MPIHRWSIPTGDFVLRNVRAPACLIDVPTLPARSDGLCDCDVVIIDGRIAEIGRPGSDVGDRACIDGDHGIVLPRLVDLHTHLDKGHIWPRKPNPDGTHWGARTSVMADREASWNAADVYARMDFAIRCAYAHGTAAIRTHIDSLGKQAAISWPVFSEMREKWKGKVDLQAVALFPIDYAVDQPDAFRALVELVARHRGVMGGMTFLGTLPDEKSKTALTALFEAAAANGLDLDFHVDESDAVEARSLSLIADTISKLRFKGKVVAGHCCSLALAPEHEISETIDRVSQSGLTVVSLPMCNMYLMGRTANLTPRWRGVTLVQELAAAGVPVAVASDNTRDPFYAYGDLDLIEVYRESIRILQLDHGSANWPSLVARTPAEVMGLSHGVIKTGASADLMLLRARTFNELNARPQNDRAVLIAGRVIDTVPPDYRELDEILGVTP